MNFKIMGKIIGKIMILEGFLMIPSLIVSFIYHEDLKHIISFIIPIIILIVIGFLFQLIKPKSKAIYQKEGFAIVSIVWIVMTFFGALPFVINGDIPNFVDALFETMSGFTTTGASVIKDVTVLKHSSLFWRSFTHWIGGMGVLVFILIFIPESSDGSLLYLLKAESPGPQVGKLASKMKVTTRILYLIYLGLSVLEVILLLLDKPLVIEGVCSKSDHLFNCLLTTFGSAGTGGFGFLPNSMEYMSNYSQYVIATFLIIFGVNFSLYYLILIGKVKEVFKSEELKAYLLLIILAIFIICLNMHSRFSTFEECFRHVYFQVASIMTTTGYTTTNFAKWAELSKFVIIVLMICGAMAGSTGGGMKISRIVIATKGVGHNIKKLIKPRHVVKSRFEGKHLEQSTIHDVFGFLTMYVFILIVVVGILSFDPINGKRIVISENNQINNVNEMKIEEIEEINNDISNNTQIVTHGFLSNFTATISCLSNIGPGLEAVGPYSSFAEYSLFSKVILTITMLIGRLEILPVLILFSPKTWKK